MDHLVLVNSKKEIESMASGQRSMLVYCAVAQRGQFCDIHAGDQVFFTVNNGAGFVLGQALVKNSFSAKDLRRRPTTLLKDNRDKLKLNDSEFKHWSKKSNILLVEFAHARPLKPFAVSPCGLSVKRPWIPINYLNQVRIS